MAREAMKRTLGMRHFDVQLIGGAVLHQGRIAEMRTGEGKTLVAPLAAVLNSHDGPRRPRRHRQRLPGPARPAVDGPGLPLPRRQPRDDHPRCIVRLRAGLPDERRAPRQPPAGHAPARPTRRTSPTARTTSSGSTTCATTWSSSSTSGCSAERSFAIVDEVDNILIDEARTPLIISGQAEESADLYFTFARLVPRLKERPEGEEEGGDYFIDLKDKAVTSTEEGVDKMEGWLSVENMYDADPRLARHFEQALQAHALYKRDRDYIVKDGEIIIVDEFTGRQMPGRRWSEGLHQAVEAKEGLRVQRESVTLATITFQNYFRLYDKLAGMTGTAMTEAEEFHKIYQLEVVAIPTHRRDDPRRRPGPRVPRRERQVQRADRRDRRDAGDRAAGPGRHDQRREVRDPRHAAEAPWHPPRGPQREVPREGVGHRRPGRPHRGGHDRDEHGRSRHRHQARWGPGRTRLGDPPQARPEPGRGGRRDL